MAGACGRGDMMRPAMRALVLLFVVGCGPIRYVGDVTRGAQTAVDQARDAQAEKYAPYYWTRAVQYLHAAREDAARADFQGANHFGRLAREAAELAANEATVADKHEKPIVPVAPAKAKDDAPVAPAKE